MVVILVKTAALLGAAIVAGTSVAPMLLPTRGRSRALRSIFVVAAAALVVASLVEVGLNLQRLLGSVSSSRFMAYLSATRHGNAVVARVVFTVGSVSVAAIPGSRLLRWLLALGLLATFSYASHAAAMGGVWPLVTDLLHFGAVAVWSSAILSVRLAPVWQAADAADRIAALARLSRIGLLAVLLLSFTGAISTLVHSSDPASFTASPYARAWTVKVLIVLVTIALAGWNRLVLLPGARRDPLDLRMRRSLTVEFVLLLAVFVATAWLTTSALPHSTQGLSTSPIENLRRWADYLLRE